MKKTFLLIVYLILAAHYAFALETFEGDNTGNGALDMQYGGTDATSAAGIRSNINVEDGAEANEPLVSQAVAEAGISETEYSWSPLRIAQAIASLASSASNFLGLSDTPDSYTGQGGKVVAVKSDATGLEFVAAGTGSGDVTGPSVAVAGNLPVLDATGKILSDSGKKPGDFLEAEADPGLTTHESTFAHANIATAYGWGNHASAGYVTGTPWTSLGYVTGTPWTAMGYLTGNHRKRISIHGMG